MIFTTTAPQLPGSRLSPPALLAVSLVHIAFFWLLLQTAPVQRVVRETVVMLNLPITQPLPKPPPKKIITLPKPPELIKPVEKPVTVKKTITTPVEPVAVPPKPPEPPKPVEKPVEKPVVVQKPPEKVVEVKPVEVVIPKEVVKEVPKELPKEIAKPVVAELPPASAPVAVAPAPAPAPAALDVAQVAEPAKTATPASLPSSASVAAPAASIAATPSTGKSNTSITTSNATPSSGASTVSVAAPAGSGTPSLGSTIVNPLGTGLGGALQGGLTNAGPGYGTNGCRRGFCPGDLANRARQQINPNAPTDKFEENMGRAAKSDCWHPGKDGNLQAINRLLNGDCPK